MKWFSCFSNLFLMSFGSLSKALSNLLRLTILSSGTRTDILLEFLRCPYCIPARLEIFIRFSFACLPLGSPEPRLRLVYRELGCYFNFPVGLVDVNRNGIVVGKV